MEAIGDVGLVGLDVHHNTGGAARVHLVAAVGLALTGLAELHDLPAEAGELQDLAVAMPIGPEPVVVLAIDEDAALTERCPAKGAIHTLRRGSRPVVGVGLAAVALHPVALLVELNDRWRRTAATGDGALHAAIAAIEGLALGVLQGAWTLNDPDVIARVNADANHLPDLPVVRKGLRKRLVILELRHSRLGHGPGLLRRERAERGHCEKRQRHRAGRHDCREIHDWGLSPL